MLVATTLEKSALSFCDAIQFQYRSSRTVPTLPFTYLLFAFIMRRDHDKKKYGAVSLSYQNFILSPTTFSHLPK